MNAISKLAWVVCFTCGTSSLQAQPQGLPDSIYNAAPNEGVKYNASTDSTVLTVKSFDEAALNKFKSNPDYNYKEAPTVAESLWDRFLQLLGQLINALLEGATTTNWGRVLVYAAAFIGLVAILLMILRVNAFRLFYTGADRGTITTSVFHENIHEMNFDLLIREAIENGRFRDGIRLLFLKSLKILTDNQLIYWQAGKTNHDYVEELNEGELKINFNELSFYFDYAWYGNFDITEDTYKKTEHLFNRVQQKAIS